MRRVLVDRVFIGWLVAGKIWDNNIYEVNREGMNSVSVNHLFITKYMQITPKQLLFKI